MLRLALERPKKLLTLVAFMKVNGRPGGHGRLHCINSRILNDFNVLYFYMTLKDTINFSFKAIESRS